MVKNYELRDIMSLIEFKETRELGVKLLTHKYEIEIITASSKIIYFRSSYECEKLISNLREISNSSKIFINYSLSHFYSSHTTFYIAFYD